MAEYILGVMNSIFAQYTVFIIGYFVALNSIYLLLIIFSFLHIRRQIKEKDVYSMHGLFASNLYNPITILAPAYNEEATVVESVNSLLQLRYPNFEVIVINDGSKDQTLQVLIDEFELERIERYVPLVLDHKPIRGIYRSRRYNELIVVDKENGRKADALNAGINVCRNDLFCAIDADCVLEPDVLQNMLRCFIEDETTIAVGGIVRVANDCVIEGNEIKEIRMPKAFLARIQVVEYLRAFLFGRVGWDYMDSLLIISGAFGIFDRNAVLRVGGYLHDTVGEDMELVVRMHRYHRENNIPYRVRFLPEPVCWTEVPEDVNVLSRQRNRWHRGLADTIWRHRKMMFNPKYGRLGTFAMPFFFLFELLSPIIELIGYIAVILMVVLGLFNPTFAALIFAATVLLGVVLSVSSVLCEEYTFRRYTNVKDVLIMIAFAFIENFGYRQLHALWRFKGLVDFLRGNKEWGSMTRKGFAKQDKKSDEPSAPKVEKATVTVLEGTPEPRVGHKVENVDVYSQKAEEIIKKYARARDNEGVVQEDESFRDAYNRRSWTKTLLPVTVLLASLLGLGIWISVTTGGTLTIEQQSLDQVNVMPEAVQSAVRIPLFADGRLQSSDHIPRSGRGATTASPDVTGDVSPPVSPVPPSPSSVISSSPSASPSDGPVASTPRPTADGPQLPIQSSVDLERVLDSIYQRPTLGHYFIGEHLFSSSFRHELLEAYAVRVDRTGYQLFVRPTYSSRFQNISWNVGFGPFPTFREAILYAERHDMSVDDIQIRNFAVQDLRIFRFMPSDARYTILLATFDSEPLQSRYVEHLQTLGFDRLRTGGAPEFHVYTGYFDLQREANLIVEHTLPPLGIHGARVVPATQPSRD